MLISGRLSNIVPCTSLLAAAASKQSIQSFDNTRRYPTDVSSSIRDQVEVEFTDGLPAIKVPLPSRKEKCLFILKPVVHKVSDFCQLIKEEDKGVDSISLLDPDGTRIAGSTSIEQLIRLGLFHLRMNDEIFAAEFPEVNLPARSQMTTDVVKTYGEVKNRIAALNATCNVGEHQLRIENQIQGKLQDLKAEFGPLEKQRLRIATDAEKRSNVILWSCLGGMGFQFGMFGRLTWWEYSWDIMEPVTYFATYSTAILSFAYYLLTRTNYEYPEAKDRLFLKSFHRMAAKERFDIERYNRLRKEISKEEANLNRLRDPFYLHLPLDRLQSLELQQVEEQAAEESDRE